MRRILQFWKETMSLRGQELNPLRTMEEPTSGKDIEEQVCKEIIQSCRIYTVM